MATHNRIRRWAPMFTCYCCKRLTRDTGIGSGSELCAYDFMVISWDNAFTDESIDEIEFLDELEKIDKQYGRDLLSEPVLQFITG